MPTICDSYAEEISVTAPSYTEKSYYYKVYSDDLFRTVWSKEVISDPSFRQVINGAEGEVNIKLARDFDNYGNGTDIILNNRVELWCSDTDSPSGVLIFTGFIYSFSPVYDKDNQYLKVTIRGYGSTLSDMILRDASDNTTLAYNSYDPSNILKDVIDKFHTYEGSPIGYTSDSIDLTGTTVSYTFNTNTYREAVNKCVELAPQGWYWTISSSGIVYFKCKSETPLHNFALNKHLDSLYPEYTLENVKNEVYVIGAESGGTNLFIRKRNVDSVAAYGRRVEKISDSRVSVSATAITMANKILNEKAEPLRRTQMKIIDNNGRVGKGYDIESVRVGDTLQVYAITTGSLEPNLWDNVFWDVDVWDNVMSSELTDNMQIVDISYTPDYIDIVATNRLPEISKRIEDINRNLESNIFADNPSAPS